jgi:hypothetical protein
MTLNLRGASHNTSGRLSQIYELFARRSAKLHERRGALRASG